MTEELHDKPQPSNTDMERAVLGSILILAATALLSVAAGDAAHGKKWPSEEKKP